MPSHASVNGVLCDVRDATVSVLDRGFMLGDGVFDTQRIVNARLPFLEEHISRLQLHAQQLGLTLPVSPAVLRREQEALVRTFGEAHGVLRTTITRGVASSFGLSAPCERATRIMLALPLPSASPSTGLRVRTAQQSPSVHGSDLKLLSYATTVIAFRAARRDGFDDVLFVDPSSQTILDASTSNVILVESGTLLTTSSGPGIVDGITRQTVLELLAHNGVSVRVQPLSINALWSADEIFLTSSVRGIVPVLQVDDHIVGTGEPGPWHERLTALYQRELLDRTR